MRPISQTSFSTRRFRYKSLILGLTPSFLVATSLFLSGCASIPRTSWKGDISPARQSLMDLCQDKGNVISVAILGNVETSLSPAAFAREGLDINQWKAGMVDSTQVTLEQAYLEYLRPYKNCHIVDRAKTDKIMEELKLSLSGAMSSDVRLQIGKLTGANHLLLFHVMRAPRQKWGGAPGLVDELTVRLISVERGELLASQTMFFDL